jgi:hypothetical protein
MLSLCLVARRAPAQAPAALGVAVGARLGSNAASDKSVRQLVGKEPEDWLDPRTGTSSTLVRACGALVEITLSVTPRAAFLNTLISNESREVLAFDPGSTLVLLGGRKRRVKTFEHGQLPLDPGWHYWMPLQLHDKTDLEDQDELEADLVVFSPRFGRCVVEAVLQRPPGPRRSTTYTPYTNLEINLSLGARLAATGKLHALAPAPGVAGGMDFDVFWGVHHGVALDIALDTLDRHQALHVSPSLQLGDNPSIQATGFFAGYVLRQPLASWLVATYSLQMGVTAVQVSDDSNHVKLTSAVYTPRQRLRFMVPIVPIEDGALFTGLTLSHDYLPYGHLGQFPLAGNLLGAQLLFGIAG